jgi:hypothetical protein
MIRKSDEDIMLSGDFMTTSFKIVGVGMVLAI